MYLLSDYDYHLPEDLIAQVPCKERSASRLLCLDRKKKTLSHERFYDLTDRLHPGDLLVVNNTRVVPARLFGKKETGGRVEVMIVDYSNGIKHLEETGTFRCDCMVRASRGPKPGTKLLLASGIEARVEKVKGRLFELSFSNGKAFVDELNSAGELPLPPYIKRSGPSGDQNLGEKDRENYQTVYAKKEGAVAAPTAGLHFTQEMMDALKKKGVEVAQITLHVGYGTFVPVRVKDIRDHEIHSEVFLVSKSAADKINLAKAQKRRVIAVGTTSVRTLEFISDENGFVSEGSGSCDLFIYPGYEFKCVDAMVTNFHLPKSTLMMLVSAFYNREDMLLAYGAAVREKYRFFSYGDAMFIE